MNTDQEVLAILRRQERDRKRGQTIAGVIALIVIVPILFLTIAAMMTVPTI